MLTLRERDIRSLTPAMEEKLTGSGQVSVAVIVPIFKHPVLLTEAVASVLSQRGASFPIHLILVDDGCPFAETQQICQSLALAHKEVTYLRKNNGGLSSARNHGIEFVCRTLPDVGYIYFLDADNRITPTMLRDTVGFLQENPGADWVYPNIDKMGIEWSGNFCAPYSRLVHILSANVCEAGSLITRRVVDAGVRFDEEMKAGYEDWEFWLQCLDRGFVGINYPHFGFEYRQRAESMVRDSNREQSSIRNYMRKKHAKLFAPEFLLQLEHNEAPRFAAIGTNSIQVRQFTDPRSPHPPVQFEEFNFAYWRAVVEPDTFRVPPFWAWIDDRDLTALSRAGVVNSVFFAAERLAEQGHFVRLILEESERTFGLNEISVAERRGPHRRARAWFARIDIVKACVSDSSDDWVKSIDEPTPAPQVIDLVVTLPSYFTNKKYVAGAATRSIHMTLSFIKTLGASVQQTRWNWREQCLPHPTYHHVMLREQFNARPVSNRLKVEGKREVGIVLPVATFGGVEKVAYNVAAELKRRGYVVHLFILGGSSFEEIDEFTSVFETKNIISGKYPFWLPGERFMGHEVALGGESGAQIDRVIGFLLCLDVILHSHVGPLNSAIGELRRLNSKIIGHFHVIDQSSRGRAVGNPYFGLAFEHAYDLMLTCSENLKEFLHGMGVPEQKLMHVPNRPGYSLSASQLKGFLDKRQRQSERNQFSALFMGRLDRQKGVSRLISTIRECRNRGLNIKWRIVGGKVITEGGDSSLDTRFSELGIVVEPPVFSGRDLASLMSEAEVLLLLSRWEGAPLSILEAQRLGCIPVATNVGAVSELIDDNVDGILIPDSDEASVVSQTCDQLADLLAQGGRRKRLSEAAVNRVNSASWSDALLPLNEKLASWFAT